MEPQALRSTALSMPTATTTSDPGRNLQALTAQGRSPDPAVRDQALRQVAREFEAILLNQMVAAMRQTVGEGGVVAKGQGEKIFEGMLDEEYARKLSGRGGPGSLADVLYRQLTHQQGVTPAAAAGTGQAASFFAQLPAAAATSAAGTGRQRP